MVKSIFQNNKECWVCNTKNNLNLHHIYFGKNRNISDKQGFTCWLCVECHKGTNGVHGRDGHQLDQRLKRLCQQRFEALGNTRQEFIRLIGKSYILD